MYAVIAVGVLAVIPILCRSPGGFNLSIAATGLIYLSYFCAILGVAFARTRGWPRQPAKFNLGRWGMVVSIVGLLYGGLMIINIALWNSPELFGDFGSSSRTYWNPFINVLFRSINGTKLDGLPAWPLYETIVGTLLVIGRSTTSFPSEAERTTWNWYRRQHRGGHRLISATGTTRADRGAASDRRAASCRRDVEAPVTDGVVLRGELREQLVGAMQKVPELAGRELTLTTLSGGITNRNFLVAPPGRRPLRHPPGRQRHASPRHQPRGRARRDRRRGRRRRRAGGDGVHPAGGLSRDPVHRRIPGVG